MQKILVPIDFSKQSEYASKMANRIAKKSKSDVYLLHLIELPTGVVDMMGIRSNFSIPQSMLYLRKVREQMFAFKDNFFDENLEVKHAIKFENPYEGIQKYAEKIDANLIVMGSKGHSDFEEILIGSNTEKVVRTSKNPVIVVKKDAKKFKAKNLVFASNFEDDNKEAFEKFLAFSNQFNSKVHLLKVNTPSKFESTQKAKEIIKNFISEYNLPDHSITIYSDSSIEEGILNFSEDIGADLIALSTHGRSGLSHIFSASVTKNLSKKALRPMLTFKV